MRASDGVSLGTFQVGRLPPGIAFDGSNIWVANLGNDNITELRASDGAVLGTFPVGNQPGGVLFDGTSIWVSVGADSALAKLNPADGSLLGRVTVNYVPSDMVFDGTKIWVVQAAVSPGMVTAVRADNGKVVGTVTVGNSNLGGIAFDGQRIYVATFGSDHVTRLSSKSGANQGTIPVDTPRGMCWDGTNLWVANYGDATVTRITPDN